MEFSDKYPIFYTHKKSKKKYLKYNFHLDMQSAAKTSSMGEGWIR